MKLIPRTRRRNPDPDWVHQFLIVLAETEPLVWRRIQVPAAYSFWDLHVAIQDAMGWLDCHLHVFKVLHPKRGRIDRLGIPVDEFIDDKPLTPDWTVPLSEYLTRGMPPISYDYDFGDDWRHVLIYEGQVQADGAVTYPRCSAGARKCPPEDCGGPHGYTEFLAAIANRRHRDHKRLLQWAGGAFDPDAFDPATVKFDKPRERWQTAFGGGA